MADMSFSWVLAGKGWASWTVADRESQAEGVASHLAAAPEELLTAVTRLVLGETDASAQFEAEPIAYRWRFQRRGEQVWVRLRELPDGRRPDEAGTGIWSSSQTVDALARAIVRGFDEAARRHGEQSYHDSWGSPFPRVELERLRTAWKRTRRTGQPDTAASVGRNAGPAGRAEAQEG